MADAWIIWCFNPLPWSTFCWIMMTLLTCIICIFGSYFIYLIWTKMKQTLLKFICISIAMCFITATILQTLLITSSIYCYISNFQTWLYQGVAAGFFNYTGLSMYYLLFFIRLNYPFKDTSFQTSAPLTFIFLFGFFLQLLFGISGSVCFLLPIELWYWAYAGMVAQQVTNLLFTIGLFVVFINKMQQLKMRPPLFKKVVKVIICAAMGLISSQLPSVISITRTIVGTNEYLFVTHVMVIVMDQFINLVSIYLQFPFGDRAYKALCGTCQRVCAARVIRVTDFRNKIETRLSPTTTNATDGIRTFNVHHAQSAQPIDVCAYSITTTPTPKT
eukprot:131574_1